MIGSKLSFMLAEDNPGDIFLIRRALDAQKLSYELLVARDGEEAIGYLAEAASGTRQIELILLDLNLPKFDGCQVLAEVNKHPELETVPTVLLTSSDSPSDRERCLALGADHYFQKPSNLAGFMELGAIVKKLIGAADT